MVKIDYSAPAEEEAAAGGDAPEKEEVPIPVGWLVERREKREEEGKERGVHPKQDISFPWDELSDDRRLRATHLADGSFSGVDSQAGGEVSDGVDL